MRCEEVLEVDGEKWRKRQRGKRRIRERMNRETKRWKERDTEEGRDEWITGNKKKVKERNCGGSGCMYTEKLVDGNRAACRWSGCMYTDKLVDVNIAAAGGSVLMYTGVLGPVYTVPLRGVLTYV